MGGKKEEAEKRSKGFDPSRREFIAAAGSAAAGLIVGGVVGSQAFPKVETIEIEKFPCPYCDKVFDTESALGDHIKTAHPDLVTKEVAKYPCPYCDQTFNSESALGDHIKTAHPDLITKEVSVPPHPQELSPWYGWVFKEMPHEDYRACEAGCAIKVLIGIDKRTGIEKAITIKGQPDDPVARGHYCIKGLAFVDSIYDPDRLLVALKRTNPEKGIDKDPGFIAIPTAQAVKEFAEKLKQYKGSEIHICSPGDPYTNRLALSLGARRSDQRAECFGTHYYLGALMFTNPPNKWYSSSYTPSHWPLGFDLSCTKYMIWFGWGAITKSAKAAVINHLPDAKKNGAKIIGFDPVKTPLIDAFADEYYPIKPGTDLAVALAMIRTIIEEKLYDEEYLKKYTDAPALIDLETNIHIKDEEGKWYAWCTVHEKAEPLKECDSPALEGAFTITFDGKIVKSKPVFQILQEFVKDYTPEWAQEISEVSASEIARIAREFANAAPFACIPNYKRDAAGPNYANSWRLMHAVNILQALVGSIDHEGGLLLFHGVRIPWLEDPKVAPPPEPFPPQPPESADYRHMFPVTENIYRNKDLSAPGHYGMLAWGLYKEYMGTKIKAILFRNPYRGLFAFIQPYMLEEALKKAELVADWNLYVDDIDYFCDYVFPAGHQYEESKLDIRAYYPKWPCLVGGPAVVKSPGDVIGWGSLARAIGETLAPVYWKDLKDTRGDVAVQEVGAASSLKEFYDKGGFWINRKPYENYKQIREIGYQREFGDGRVRLYIDEFVEVGHDPLPKWAPRWMLPEGEYKFSLLITRAPWLMHADPNFLNNPILKKISEKNYINCAWISPATAQQLGLKEGDEVVIETNPKFLKELPRPVKAKVHISKRISRNDCILLFHGMGHRTKYLKVGGNDWGYRDGDLIPQKDPNIVKQHDPTGMGWVEDVYVSITKA